jgi:hypothetical protein
MLTMQHLLHSATDGLLYVVAIGLLPFAASSFNADLLTLLGNISKVQAAYCLA